MFYGVHYLIGRGVLACMPRETDFVRMLISVAFLSWPSFSEGSDHRHRTVGRSGRHRLVTRENSAQRLPAGVCFGGEKLSCWLWTQLWPLFFQDTDLFCDPFSAVCDAHMLVCSRAVWVCYYSRVCDEHTCLCVAKLSESVINSRDPTASFVPTHSPWLFVLTPWPWQNKPQLGHTLCSCSTF